MLNHPRENSLAWSNPHIEEFVQHSDDDGGGVRSPDEENMRLTISYLHKQEMEHLRANHRQFRRTILESNPMVYVEQQ